MNSNDPAASSQQNPPAWEREVLEKLLHATLNEQKAKRRWGIFFKLISLAILAAGFAFAFGLFDFAKSSDNTPAYRVDRNSR
jgi:protease IV